MTSVKAIIDWPSIVSRIVLFSLIWWMLADGATSSWWIGVPAVLLAVITSITLLPSLSLTWLQFLRFIPFFLLRSLLGGIDVAWRTFHPRMPIDPDLIEYRLRIPSGLPQVFMSNAVNLLPGTLSATLDQNMLQIHVLDRRKDFLTELQTVERNVARIFGTSMMSFEGDQENEEI